MTPSCATELRTHRIEVKLAKREWFGWDFSVRKWVVIGLVELVIFVSVLIMRPGDPLERHKRAFQAARQKISGRNWFTPVEEFYFKITATTRRPRGLTSNEISALHFQLESNRTALVKLGFVVERTFIISNQPVDVVATRVSGGLGSMLPKARHRFTLLDCRPKPNVMVVTGFAQDMRALENAIRKADVY